MKLKKGGKNTLKDKLKLNIGKVLNKQGALPILFVGAGISQRYLKLANWEGLLRYLAQRAKESEYSFEAYKNRAKNSEIKVGEFQKIAELIEIDLALKWFEEDKFKKLREEYTEDILNGVSPLKIEIANYIKTHSLNLQNEMKEEIEYLKKVGKKSIASVITTNYDTLLENIFSDYTRFIGQEELIFSKIHGVGEIYKIHGCCTKPESIIINEDDYIDFQDKNPYLASKILTLFLEHPIIFIGYSIGDENIRSILKSIVKCLSKEKIEILKERLIFVEWDKEGDNQGFSTHTIAFDDGKFIDMTKISLQNYAVLFEAMLQNKAKYNAPMLRKLKEDIYELVLTNEPKEKIKVVGLEDDDKLENIEVVVGVGVISELGKKGYETFTAEEIYKDIVFDNRNFEAEIVVKSTLPNLLKQHSKSIPIYKYVSKVKTQLPSIIEESIKENYDDFLNNTLKKTRERNDFSKYSISELKKDFGDMKCLEYIPLLNKDKISIQELREFLKDVLTDYPQLLNDGKQTDKTNLKRLIRIYDWLVYYNKQ